MTTKATQGATRGRTTFLALGGVMAAAAAALISAAPAAAKGDVTTLRTALETALANSPEIATQYKILRGLDENVATARSGMRPTVSGSITAGGVFDSNTERVGDETKDRYPATINLTGSQTLYDSGRTKFAIKGALAAVEGGRFNLFQTEQSVLLNAITAYIQILTAEQNVRLARNNVDVIRRQLQAAQDRFEVGEVTRTDVAQAEAALAESLANLATQQGELRRAAEAYRRFVGVPPGKLANLPPLPELPGSIEEARAIALEKRPSILAAKSNVKAAGFSVKEAIGALGPQLTLSGTLSSGANTVNRGSGVNSAEVTATVSVPIYSGGALRADVRRNKALKSQRFHELRTEARRVLQEVGNAWQDLMTARATSRSNRAAVKAQEIAFNGVREEAKVGSRTTLDVLEAEQRLLDARVSLVTSRANERTAAYTLLNAIGVLNIETLDLRITRKNPKAYHDWAQGFVSSSIEVRDETDESWLNNWKP